MYQWAEIHKIADGFGISRPIAAQPRVQTLSCSAFIGLPCPKKIAGIFWVIKRVYIALIRRWTKIGVDITLSIASHMDIRKAALIFLGTVCVGLGVLGMFLPLLPTTVFLLMAAYCYSHSSERFHTWLLNNRWCGSYIRNYKSGQGISIRQKVSTIAVLWASIGLSLWLLNAGLWLALLLIAIAAAVSIHMLMIKTFRTPVSKPTSVTE